MRRPYVVPHYRRFEIWVVDEADIVELGERVALFLVLEDSRGRCSVNLKTWPGVLQAAISA